MEHSQIPRVKLGTQGLEVSKLGFGCMGLTGVYNAPVAEEDGVAVVRRAFEAGVTFFDTSDAYGPHTNEVLLGKALKQLPREKVQVATKFGIAGFDASGMLVKGTPDYVRACCEASLERLDVDYIDLYYQHRIDQSVPIEETMGELKKLVEEGKVKFVGLSEASADTIRRAHAVHPITAVQMEWSLWTRDIEEEIIPLCRELGIGIVPYSPIGRGFFAGRAAVQSIPSESWLTRHPRYNGENLEKNKVFYTRIEELATKYGCSPAQLALSWVLHQGDDVVPIPGTTKVKNLDDNIGAVKVKLSKEDQKEISAAVPAGEVAGSRLIGVLEPYSWRVANTPAPKSLSRTSATPSIMGVEGLHRWPWCPFQEEPREQLADQFFLNGSRGIVLLHCPCITHLEHRGMCVGPGTMAMMVSARPGMPTKNICALHRWNLWFFSWTTTTPKFCCCNAMPGPKTLMQLKAMQCCIDN
uniref:NADP-dependent oxidoreductase domain-containing protein n=1 Tax=Oryza meridionalis TaxID=40149 RepID=A0A0E0EXY3_9ORYZ